MSHEEIAMALGISRKTLEKHFEHELSVGAYSRRLEVLESMQRAARKGSVSAAKAYLQFEPHLAVPPGETQQPEKPAETAPAAKPEKRQPPGKKEQQQQDAHTAAEGSDWGEVLPRFSSSGLPH